METRTPGAPGLEAIERALAPLYPGQEPSRMIDADYPLPTISGYFCAEPVQHWHLVTHGFSAPLEGGWHAANRPKVAPGPNGYGFELTMRVPCRDGERTPPDWAFGFLQNVAGYAFRSGNLFRLGDYMNLNGPITTQEPTLLCSMMLVRDAALPPIASPGGEVQFLQIVGITADEEKACKLWHTVALAQVFAPHLPALVTETRRASLMERPEVRAAVESGSLRDGSRTGHLYADEKLSWAIDDGSQRPRLRVTIGALQWPEVLALLERRIPFDRQFLVIGPRHRLVFVRGEVDRHSTEGAVAKLEIRRETVQALRASVPPLKGTYVVDVLSDGLLEVEILASHIRSSDGRIVDTVG